MRFHQTSDWHPLERRFFEFSWTWAVECGDHGRFEENSIPRIRSATDYSDRLLVRNRETSQRNAAGGQRKRA